MLGLSISFGCLVQIDGDRACVLQKAIETATPPIEEFFSCGRKFSMTEVGFRRIEPVGGLFSYLLHQVDDAASSLSQLVDVDCIALAQDCSPHGLVSGYLVTKRWQGQMVTASLADLYPRSESRWQRREPLYLSPGGLVHQAAHHRLAQRLAGTLVRGESPGFIEMYECYLALVKLGCGLGWVGTGVGFPESRDVPRGSGGRLRSSVGPHPACRAVLVQRSAAAPRLFPSDLA
ncbi:hypothetical protein BJP25_05540 [Actinokineospora bangkokensis]|uniref:Uncharacterized protein n=1 Tax=Actinokineospora bangkokensis TaxID=1193682 RepID=A0A1Q9LBZ5_9PSEU|nr:hypothetical protein BJP25_05540 [Actinokineospora bangkokensis]